MSEVLQEAEGGLENAQAELAETRQQSDSELTRLGSEWDNTKQSLEDLEVHPPPIVAPHFLQQHLALLSSASLPATSPLLALSPDSKGPHSFARLHQCCMHMTMLCFVHQSWPGLLPALPITCWVEQMERRLSTFTHRTQCALSSN